MNSISHAILWMVQYSLYVDELQISVSSCNLSIFEHRLQVATSNLIVAGRKCVYIFYRKNCMHLLLSKVKCWVQDPCLTLNNSPISVKKGHRFLGLLFDSKLTFGLHIKQLRTKCQKSLNILRVLSHRFWGSDRTCLLGIYHCMV